MKSKFYGLFAVAALAAATASTASASVLCAGISDVTTIAGLGGCTVAGSSMLFSNFSVSASAGFTSAQVGLAPVGQGTTTIGPDVDLAFQIGGLQGTGVAAALGDVELLYTVQGGMSGVDITLQASPVTTGGIVTVTEVACNQAFVAGVCGGTTLANYTVISSGNAVSNQEFFIPSYFGEVWIKKDISYDGATTSELVNSQISVPEPMTFSLMGAGLLGLGLLGRRLRK
jgi:hypothetical protein